MRSVRELLQRQNKTFKKQSSYIQLQHLLDTDAALRKTRLSRTAWKLLQEPRLKPCYIDNFSHTYHFRNKEFLQLFIQLKWEEKERKAKRKQKINLEIQKNMASWPGQIKLFYHYLYELEKQKNPDTPLWLTQLLPRTIKESIRRKDFSLHDWVVFLDKYLILLEQRYKTLRIPDRQELIDRMILYALGGKQNSMEEIKNGYRKASKEKHPDAGGKQEDFLLIRKSYERLLESIK